MKINNVIAIMPGLNVEKTLVRTYKDIPKDIVGETILVDDGSNDKTAALAKKLGMKVISHPQNRGYGGSQKTCYTVAISEGAKVVVMIHPDYQYDPKLTGELVRPILQGRMDIMLGSRIRTRKEALDGGMPLYKYFGNRFLTIAQNIVLGQNLSEYHTGFRAFKREVLLKLPFHKFSDDFVFDQEILISAVRQGYKIGEIPVPVSYTADSSSISFQKSVKYGVEIFINLAWYLLDAMGIYTKDIFVKK